MNSLKILSIAGCLCMVVFLCLLLPHLQDHFAKQEKQAGYNTSL